MYAPDRLIRVGRFQPELPASDFPASPGLMSIGHSKRLIGRRTFAAKRLHFAASSR
jgi:hypothetical protein